MHLGPWEIGIVLAVVALLFGGKKLPELGKGMAEFLKNFKRGIKDVEKETEDIKHQLHP